MFRRGLFWKFFGASVVLIVLTALVAGWTASRRLGDDVRRDTEAALGIQIELLHAQLAPDVPAEFEPVFQARVRALGARTGTRITVVRADGLVLADSSKEPADMGNHADRPEIRRSRTEALGRAVRHSDTMGVAMVYVARRIEGPSGPRAYVRGAQPLLKLEERLESLYTVVLGAALVAIVIGLLAALFFAQRLARPLRSMAQASLAIAAGEFERRVPADSADEVGALGRAFNMMGRRLAKEVGTIRRERRELHAILGGMVEGVIAVDADERIVLMNDAAGRIVDMRPEEAAGRPLGEVLQLPQVPATLADAIATGEAVAADLDLERDGGVQAIRLHASPLAGDPGAHGGIVLVLEDVTDRRRSDAVRRDFIANASHELKTPVAVIRGLIETILEDPEMEASTRRGFLERVLRQSDRLGGVVAEMLSLSRLESDGFRLDAAPHDIRDPLGEALDDAAPLAAGSRVTLDVKMPDEPLLVRGPSAAVRRIAGNLIDNAIKYSEPEASVLVRAYRIGDKVELAVTDHGAGIPLDKQARVFERFYRVDEGRAREVGGSGLGLAIVKHLVQSMGGEVEIDSRPGAGSTFRVAWPQA